MSFGVPGAASGCLLGSLGRLWGAFWGPWATLGGPLGPLWRPKGDHRTWAKNGAGLKKNIPPLWGTFGSKMAPQGTKMRPKSDIFRPKLYIGIRTLSGYVF